MRIPELSITPGQRFAVGLIATLVKDGQLKTIHETGSARVALKAIAGVCDAGGWKVHTISSPKTIFRDLQGHREYRIAHGAPMFGADGESVAETSFPEFSLLATIDRIDLLARPRSAGAIRSEQLARARDET